MRPRPAARICAITARFTRTMPKKSALNRRWASAVSVNSTAPEIPKPALFTTTSICPSASMTCCTAARTCVSSVMSARMWCSPSTPASRRENS